MRNSFIKRTESKLKFLSVMAVGLIAIYLMVGVVMGEEAKPAAPGASAETTSTQAAVPAAAGQPAPTPAAVTSPAVTGSEEAVILSVTGGAAQYSVDEGVTWQAVKKDVKLPRNTMIRTGFASTCEISFAGHTVILVESLSSLRISDYIASAEGDQKVRANLQYGAVRCGVEKGRVKSDTEIKTPVAALSIRGTIARIEYDRGTGECLFSLIKDGPADVFSWNGRYSLREGMKTNQSLANHLKTSTFDRFVSVTGSKELGDMSYQEAMVLAQSGGATDLRQDDPRTLAQEAARAAGTGGEECPNGECDPGPR